MAISFYEGIYRNFPLKKKPPIIKERNGLPELVKKHITNHPEEEGAKVDLKFRENQQTRKFEKGFYLSGLWGKVSVLNNPAEGFIGHLIGKTGEYPLVKAAELILKETFGSAEEKFYCDWALVGEEGVEPVFYDAERDQIVVSTIGLRMTMPGSNLIEATTWLPRIKKWIESSNLGIAEVRISFSPAAPKKFLTVHEGEEGNLLEWVLPDYRNIRPEFLDKIANAHVDRLGQKIKIDKSSSDLREKLNLAKEGIFRAAKVAQVENSAAKSLLSAHKGIGAYRITIYGGHYESFKAKKRLKMDGSGDEIDFREETVSNGESGFDRWKTLEKFSGEVMADVLLTKEIQIVVDPAHDPRCERLVNGVKTLTTNDPFVLIPEIVDGEVKTVYKLDFKTEKLKLKEEEIKLIQDLMSLASKRKEKLRDLEVKKEFSELHAQETVINWMLALLTSGGFADMPEAVESNRAAVFLKDENGVFVGKQAIGDVVRGKYDNTIAQFEGDIYKDGIKKFLKDFDQSGSELNQLIQGKDFSLEIFAVDGRPVGHLLLNLGNEELGVQGKVYIDNAFNGRPLALRAKIERIIKAAAERLAEIRQAAGKKPQI